VLFDPLKQISLSFPFWIKPVKSFGSYLGFCIDSEKKFYRHQLEPSHHNWLVHRDLAEDVSVLEVIKDEGTYRVAAIDMEVGDRTSDGYTYRGGF